MKKTIILLSVLFMMTACGDSKDKALSTNQSGTSKGRALTSGGSNGGGSTSTSVLPGDTPYSHGYSSFRADLFLEFNKNSSDSVTAVGDLEMSQKVGFGDCVLPLGEYDVSTVKAGTQGDIAHHYKNIELKFNGPVDFTALAENTLALQNLATAEWVMSTNLKVQSVDGATCNYNLSFSAAK